MIEQFLSRADARKYSISQHELERRWKALRERMAAKKIDYLVVQSQNRGVGGYFRWFTDLPGGNYPNTAVFPLDGDMTIISHGPAAPAPPANPPDWALRGGKEKINTPAFPNVWWEDAWDADKAVEVMMRKKPKTVGLVGLGNMSAALYENVKKGLPKVNIVNATDLVDEVRMVKSEEELSLHREAAYMHEMSYEVAKEAIEPGRTIEEVILDIRIAQMEAGSEEQQVAIAFGQPGAPHHRADELGQHLHPTEIAGRRHRQPVGGIEHGGRLLVRYAAIPLYRSAFPGHTRKPEIVREARAIMAENCKPGLLPGVAVKACDKFLKSKGCPPEARVSGHGQGLDLVERPVFLKDEVCEA